MNTGGHLKRWRTWVQQSPVRFILICGVIGWGIPLGLLGPLAPLAAVGQLHLLRRMYEITIPLGLSGGFVFGLLMWRKIQKLTARDSDRNDDDGRKHSTD